MMFMLVTRPKPGTRRDQLVERLTHRIQPETWDLIRHGELTNILYKVGDEPGFFAVLDAPSLEDPKAKVDRGEERLNLFEIDIVPVKQFPHFD